MSSVVRKEKEMLETVDGIGREIFIVFLELQLGKTQQ
jgi:hypothetical protein